MEDKRTENKNLLCNLTNAARSNDTEMTKALQLFEINFELILSFPSSPFLMIYK